MTLVRWTPTKEIESMRRDMERIFSGFFDPSPARRHVRWPATGERGVNVPGIEMYDRKGEIIARVELPGVDKKDLDLTITKDSLTIKGESKKGEEVKEEDYYLSELTYGSFSRTIGLPVEVDNEKAKASFKDGILEIVMPKREEAKAKEIKIEVS